MYIIHVYDVCALNYCFIFSTNFEWADNVLNMCFIFVCIHINVFYLPYLGYGMFHLNAFLFSVFVTRLMVLDAYQHIYNGIILHNGVYISMS